VNNDANTAAFASVKERMTEIWKKILGHEEFDVTDNFFDVGGHSLVATELAIAIENEFSVRIPAGAVFDHPSITELCSFIKDNAQFTLNS
jgi:acyl carrier protein